MAIIKLSPDHIQTLMTQLDPVWCFIPGQSQLQSVKQDANAPHDSSFLQPTDALQAHFKFKDFKSAFAFMTRVAQVADDMNHHPEWFNIYSRVDITLRTHDSKGLTQLDFDLAQAIDQLV
jgi:4a-hydroxytetrahydrobiopterin dehydratase